MANLTFPSNPTNGQKVTVNDKVFVYNSTTSRWTATRLQILGNLTDNFTIDAPTLGVSLSTVALDTVGQTAYITYTVDQDVKVRLTTSGLENTTATLHQTNTTIVVTAGATEFSGGQISLVVSNGRSTDTEVIDVSAVYETIQGLSTPSSWTQVGSYGASSDPKDNTYANKPANLAVYEDHLYTISGSTFITIDVTNKTAPTKVDTDYDFQLGHLNSSTATQLLINIGNHIVGTGPGGGGGPTSYVFAYDVSTPSNPSYSSRVAVGSFGAYKGKVLYNGLNHVFVLNEYSDSNFVSVDVSNMSSLSAAGSINNVAMPDNEMRFPHVAELYGDYAIIAVNATDETYTIPTFTIIDVSDPTSLSLHGSFDLPAFYGISGGDGNTVPTASAFKDGIMYLFFKNHDIVQAWDFSSNILSPSKVAEYSSATLLNAPVGAVVDPVAEHIYVMCDSRVEILDISSAASGTITHVSSSPTNNPRGLALVDNYVFVNDYDIDGETFVGDLKIYN